MQGETVETSVARPGTHWKMQGETIETSVARPGHEGREEDQRPLYDFSDCSRIKKLTTHDIYRFKHQDVPLVVKLYAHEALPNYEQEVDSLARMTHDQILKVLYSRNATNPLSYEPLEKCHLIVMNEATRSDLSDYLPRFGRMHEKMARTYFKQLVEGLATAARLKPAVMHPNLQASSILLGDSGQLYICGWSELSLKDQQAQLEESLFSCGEVLVCMLTSFMPFYKKYSTTDAFFKFISEEHIHKFWQELQKRMGRIDKQFAFAPALKALAEGIFLKKIKSFEQMQEQEWLTGEVYSNGELLSRLEENEKVKLEKLAIRRKQEATNNLNRKKVLMELSFGPQRSSSQEEEQFISDYQENMMKDEELPQGVCNMKVEGSPGFVIASLSEFLRQENGKLSVMVQKQFVLSNYQVVRANNCILIDLTFAVSLLEDEDEEGFVQPPPADKVSLKLKLSFYRSETQVYAEMEAVESNFNSYYTTLAMRVLEEKINKRRQAHFSQVPPVSE